MQFTYNYHSGGSSSAPCMYNASNGYEANLNYVIPAAPVACTAGNSCGFSQAYATYQLPTERVITKPANGATEVPISLNQFELNFSLDMDSSAINNSSISLKAQSSSTNLLASCASTSLRKYICTSSVGLVPNTTYALVGTNLPIVGGGSVTFSNSFTTKVVATKYAYVASVDNGVWRCTVGSESGLSSCSKLHHPSKTGQTEIRM